MRGFRWVWYWNFSPSSLGEKFFLMGLFSPTRAFSGGFWQISLKRSIYVKNWRKLNVIFSIFGLHGSSLIKPQIRHKYILKTLHSWFSYFFLLKRFHYQSYKNAQKVKKNESNKHWMRAKKARERENVRAKRSGQGQRARAKGKGKGKTTNRYFPRKSGVFANDSNGHVLRKSFRKFFCWLELPSSSCQSWTFQHATENGAICPSNKKSL